MRFVLTYSGPLPANGDARAKHRIRKALLPQLRRQWEIDPALIEVAARRQMEGIIVAREGFRFAPLVARDFSLVCYLELTLLRDEAPGNVLHTGGDIDNRLKTLFDSLSLPLPAQIAGMAPEEGEDPFYCLLEDDSLVTGFQVKTERLLETPANANDVHLNMTVVVRPTRVTIANVAFLGGWL